MFGFKKVNCFYSLELILDEAHICSFCVQLTQFYIFIKQLLYILYIFVYYALAYRNHTISLFSYALLTEHYSKIKILYGSRLVYFVTHKTMLIYCLRELKSVSKYCIIYIGVGVRTSDTQLIHLLDKISSHCTT
jgi:hypothetical protein